MRLRPIDYYTIAGLAIFLILSICYIAVFELHVSLSPTLPEISPDSVSLPQIPDINLDWFYTMDPVSKLLFSFLMLLIGATAIGCTWIYLKYRKTRTGK